MRLLVCGGRYFNNQAALDAILDQVKSAIGITCVIQGGQKFWFKAGKCFIGADYQALQWALKRGVPCDEESAQWAKHGLRAGPLRNGLMIRKYKPEWGVAFPGGNGTADCVYQMRAAGIKVLEVSRELMEYTLAHTASATPAQSCPSAENRSDAADRAEMPHPRVSERDPA